MRVLHFRSTCAFAGPEAGLLRLGVALQELGIRQRIIAYYRRRPPQPAVHRLIEEGRHLGLAVDQWDDHSRFPWKTVRRLAHEVKHGGYDLLVTHDYKTDVMGYLAARRTGIPCLAVSHGHHLSLFRMRLYRRIDLMILRRFPRVVAVSEALRQELIAGGLSPDRVCVVHNAIDIPRFVDGARERGATWRLGFVKPSAPVVLTVARLYGEKGLKYLVDAAARVHAIMPQVRFLIAGEGMLRQRLEAQVRRLGLDGIVVLLGQQRDIAALMAASDVIVLPSLSEGLSNTLLEAMALTKPVVATRVGGTPEVVQDGDTGWLVPPREPDTLAAAIIKVLEDPSLAARIATHGREHVASSFTVTDIAAQMAGVYRHAVTPRP